MTFKELQTLKGLHAKRQAMMAHVEKRLVILLNSQAAYAAGNRIKEFWDTKLALTEQLAKIRDDLDYYDTILPVEEQPDTDGDF